MSQGSYQVPTGGSESAITFAGQCNTAWQALASMNSGGSAPANGPGSAPLQYQLWADTTNASFPVVRCYDSASWPRFGTIDVSGHNFLPQMGGGAVTMASASTVDIGASPQTYITISGAVAITSLGSSAQIGEEKNLHFTGSATLTNGANIICQGAANIVALPGDTCRAIYIGTGAWVIVNYMRSLAAAGSGLQTGDVVWSYATVARNGFVRCNGLNIGDAASGATELASAACINLFTLIWNNSASDPEITVGGGRGASAAADWAAHKTIVLPDLRGRAPFGLDTMGAPAVSRITSFSAAPDGQTLGAVGGGQTMTIVLANLPAYTPAGGVVFSSSGTNSYTPAGTVTVNDNNIFGQLVVSAGAQKSAWITDPGHAGITASFAGTPVTASFAGTAQGGTSTGANKMPGFKLGTFFMAL